MFWGSSKIQCLMWLPLWELGVCAFPCGSVFSKRGSFAQETWWETSVMNDYSTCVFTWSCPSTAFAKTSRKLRLLSEKVILVEHTSQLEWVVLMYSCFIWQKRSQQEDDWWECWSSGPSWRGNLCGCLGGWPGPRLLPSLKPGGQQAVRQGLLYSGLFIGRGDMEGLCYLYKQHNKYILNTADCPVLIINCFLQNTLPSSLMCLDSSVFLLLIWL